MEQYVYISSEDSSVYFTNNNAHTFKIHLKSPLVLDSSWRVAIVEFYAKSGKTKLKTSEQDVYVYSDICSGSIVKGEEQPLLRRFVKNDRNAWNYVIDTPFYLPLKKHLISELQVCIKDSAGDFAAYLENPVKLTLVFKPQ